MQLIGAGFGDHVHHCAGIAAIFRIEGIGDDPELRDAVRRRLNRGQIGEQVVAIASVDRIVVGAPAAAVHGDHAGFVGTVK